MRLQCCSGDVGVCFIPFLPGSGGCGKLPSMLEQDCPILSSPGDELAKQEGDHGGGITSIPLCQGDDLVGCIHGLLYTVHSGGFFSQHGTHLPCWRS